MALLGRTSSGRAASKLDNTRSAQSSAQIAISRWSSRENFFMTLSFPRLMVKAGQFEPRNQWPWTHHPLMTRHLELPYHVGPEPLQNTGAKLLDETHVSS